MVSVLRDPQTTEDARHAIAEHKKLDDLFMIWPPATWRRGAGWCARPRAATSTRTTSAKRRNACGCRGPAAADGLALHAPGVDRRKRAEKAAKVEKKIRLKD